MSPLSALFRREAGLAWGGGGALALAAGFYAAVVALVPLSAGPAPDRLASVAPGLAWLALALTSLLSIERMFEGDLNDGALDLLALGPVPLELTVAVKALTQWLTVGIPLAVLAPVGAMALGAEPRTAPVLLATALLGGLSFAFVGSVGAALAAGSRRGGLLIALLVLPLLVPPVIFGAGAVQAAADGGDAWSGLALLAAYSLASVALSPLAAAAAIRNVLS